MASNPVVTFSSSKPQRKTEVTISGERFFINGNPTYQGRTGPGYSLEGLLLNARFVQAIFDDLNPDTRDRWAYPDTGVWDAERNVGEFLTALPEYRKAGMLGLTLCLQGGSPEGYSKNQPWINTAFTAYGDLRADYLGRLKRVLDAADELGLVVILSLFYFGQDERLLDEKAVVAAVDNAVGFVLDEGYRNVIVEINNECDIPRYEHSILTPERVHELIERAKAITRNGRNLLVGTSYRGGSAPGEKVLAVSDLALLHGNGVSDPKGLVAMIDRTRELSKSRPIPIVVNEDDHFNFEEGIEAIQKGEALSQDRPINNLLAATTAGASWGYYDAGPGSGGAWCRSDYVEGYQNVPVNWAINTPNKRGFFATCRLLTASDSES